MNGIAALLRWSGAPLAAAELEPLLATLGGAGSPPVAGDDFALVAATAAPSASLAETHLAVDSARRLVVAFCGRLDERDAFARAAGVDGARSPARDDAALLLAAFAAAGDRVLDRIVGPFVALVVDTRARTAVLARDPLGGRSLYLRALGSRLAVASRPSALARFGGVPAAFDERAIARFLAIGGPPAGASFFHGVEELPPGAVLTLGADGRRAVRRIPLAIADRPGRGRDADYHQRFRELLDEAVACRLPAVGRTAVLMSGGLDSTSVAATAARLLASRGARPPLTLSWVFDELVGIDERRWIDVANRASGAEGLAISADELWPLSDEATWPQPLDAPTQSPFAQPRRRALAAAAAAGSPVLLTGESADDLWWASSEWLRSLLLDGRLAGAASELTRLVALILRGRVPRRSLRDALARLRRPHGYLPQRSAWPWLTPWANSLVAAPAAGEAGDPCWRDFEAPAHPLIFPLDLSQLRVAEEEAAPFGVAIRRPYRDRRLVEFMLGVPPRLLYRPGERKLLLRRALADRLPPAVLARRERTTLLPLYHRGVGERARETVAATLDDADALWPRFVRQEWLRGGGQGIETLGDGAEALVVWHCLCLERWRRIWRSPLAS
jgi:asparagine synthase (glutamine-hydrolysing)